MSKPNPFHGLRRLLDRRFFIALLILVQIVFLIAMLLRSYNAKWVAALLVAFSVVTALHLLMRPDKSAYKLSLVFLILMFPVIGGALYWIFHFQTTSVGFRRGLEKHEKEAHEAFEEEAKKQDDFSLAMKEAPESRKLLHYMRNNTPFPVCRNTDSTYFASGKEMLEPLLADLQSAERYIFLEYFIIEEGEMWNAILKILRKKVKAGVDVRVIYDDLGCILTLPPNYAKKLRSYGIQCQQFNPFHPFLTSIQNNRDHRKIAVVDGKVAYTGGINLADEYIDRKIKHGRWKDSGIRLCGDAAWSFTVIFLQTWNFLTRKPHAPYEDFRPMSEAATTGYDGWVLPYSDSPVDKENVGEHIYLRIIEQAQDYLYITTPYLMVDDSMLSALKLCAKSGVDVRIITPEIPDKKTVHFTTRSYYQQLILSGVKIYEYSGGFIHAKSFASDDTIATVGTVNLDFRSLYLHFECGACLYRTSSIQDIKADYLKTLESCRQVTEKDCKRNLFVSFWRSICRIFAPLM